ncbi:MAG TPA: HPF/RaiA family ribosome-associated protein [Usitatibacter sp.]|nr:HPF/RaiA family ribosome-associated protein [Usitatibacter sp.]
MDASLQITMQNLPPSEALEARIRRNAAKLEHVHRDITSCRVVVDEVDRRHRQGREFRVRVEVRARGHEEAVSTFHQHEDVYVALRDAFQSAGRQLAGARPSRRFA